MQEQNQTHMISIDTYHLACAEGSALQCSSLKWQVSLLVQIAAAEPSLVAFMSEN